MAVKWMKPYNKVYEVTKPPVDLGSLPPIPAEVASVPLEQLFSEMIEGRKLLAVKDRTFFNSLASSYVSFGDKISVKQVYWARRLYARALGLMDEAPPPPAAVEVGSLSGLYALFDKAKQKLKHPSLVLANPAGGVVVLKLAGPSAKVPGTLNVSDDGAWPDNRWYGRVDIGGAFQPNAKLPEEVIGPITRLLKQLSADPMGAAKKNAVLNGKCICCNKPLSDPKSTALGIGPECSKNWGLYEEWKKASSIL